jgi:hypothetical protein
LKKVRSFLSFMDKFLGTVGYPFSTVEIELAV